MLKKTTKSTLALAVTAALAGSMGTTVVNASENPFQLNKLSNGYEQIAAEGKCGEGKCGGDKKKEGKCGEGKKKEGKCGEGKCGGDKKKEGKCGEGKCGEGKTKS